MYLVVCFACFRGFISLVKKPDKIGLFGANIFFIRIGCPMCIKRFFSADLRQGLEPPKKANRFFAEYQ